MKIKLWVTACALAAMIYSCDGEKNGGEIMGITDRSTAEAPIEEGSLSTDFKSLGNGNFAGAADSVSVGLADNTKPVAVTNKNGSTPQAPAAQQPPVKKLIKNGTLKMEVDDYSISRKNINALLPKFNAYIGGENETNDGHKINGYITIRVPYNKFDGLLEAVSGEGEYILDKTVNVSDVTAEYVDLGVRLKTKMEVEARYRDILKKAQKIPDILSVENELRVIREEIESAQGRMKYIDDQASYSTLSIEMYEQLPYTSPPQAGFFGNIAEAFVNGWNGLLSFMVGIIGMWPFLLFLGVAVFFLRRFWKRKVA